MSYATKYPRPRLEGWAVQQDLKVEPGLVSTPRLFPCDVCGKRTGFRGGYRLSTPICSEACYGQTPLEEDHPVATGMTAKLFLDGKEIGFASTEYITYNTGSDGPEPVLGVYKGIVNNLVVEEAIDQPASKGHAPPGHERFTSGPLP